MQLITIHLRSVLGGTVMGVPWGRLGSSGAPADRPREAVTQRGGNLLHILKRPPRAFRPAVIITAPGFT